MNCKKCKKELIELRYYANSGAGVQPLCPYCDATIIASREKTTNEIIAKKMVELGVPERFKEITLTKEDMAFQDSDLVSSGGVGLFLLGESGTGKTRRMVGWLRHFLLHGKTCKFIDFSSFLFDARAKKDLLEYNAAKTECTGVDIVFIDDFEVTNVYMYDFVYNFLNTLYNANKVAFFTNTTLPIHDKLAMRIGDMTVQIELLRGR